MVVPTKLVDIQTKALWMSTPHVCKRTRQLSGVGGKGENGGEWGRRRDEVSVQSRCKGCRVGRVRLTWWCALTGKSYATAKYGTEAGTRVDGLERKRGTLHPAVGECESGSLADC